MNQEFEAIVMGNYAELCIMWRIAHVKDPGQEHVIDAKLKSLESVIEAFGMAMPDLAEGDYEAQAPAQQQLQPQPQQPRAAQGVPGQSRDGVVLEDWD